MKMMKKITAAVLAAALTGTIAVTASATDAIGSYEYTTLTMGQKATDKIPCVKDSYGGLYYDDGANYKDFKITIPENGILVLIYDVNIDSSRLTLCRDDTKALVKETSVSDSTGSFSESYGRSIWDSNVGVYSGVIQYNVTKGDHFIRIQRYSPWSFTKDGQSGDGTINLTAYMKKPGDVNNDGRINAADAAAVLKHVAELEKLSSIGAINADANNDGKLNAADAAAILRDAAGIEKIS